MRVLIFGDSIVQGYWDSKGGWADRLKQHFNSKGLENIRNRNFTEIFNLGISGGGLTGLLERFDSEVIARKWPGEDFVMVFSLGANDAMVDSDGKEFSTPEKFKKQLEELVAKAGTYA